MKDPIIAEVRKHRLEHTAQFGGDLHRICEDLRRLELQLGDRLVKRVVKKTASGKRRSVD